MLGGTTGLEGGACRRGWCGHTGVLQPPGGTGAVHIPPLPSKPATGAEGNLKAQGRKLWAAEGLLPAEPLRTKEAPKHGLKEAAGRAGASRAGAAPLASATQPKIHKGNKTKQNNKKNNATRVFGDKSKQIDL